MDVQLAVRPCWWQWPTVLSLDAPSVALTWQVLFARVLHVELGWYHHLLLGLGTWIVYATDRWLDGWSIEPDLVSTQRHRFYQQYRWPVAVAIGVAVVAEACVAGMRLTSTEWYRGVELVLLVVAYLMAGVLLRRAISWKIPKEFLVAVLFALGTGCFPMAVAGAAGVSLFAPLTWFASLCLTNLLLIARWERTVDTAHRQSSTALALPRMDPFLRSLPWVVASSSAVAAWSGLGGSGVVTGCVASAGLLLGLLDIAQQRIGRQMARALVDAALLTPLVPLLLGISG